MITLRRANERGHVNHGWLDTYHSFSFASYYDPRHMGFRSLRVMNEDWVAPGQGFGTHPHKDAEIVTYVLEGTLTHRDSLGTVGAVKSGEFQRITAGTGITHSEFNDSASEPVHLYQIWLYPDRRGLTPSYEQKSFSGKPGRRLVASPDGRDGSLRIHQDATISVVDLTEGEVYEQPIAPGRHLWVQVVRGQVSLPDASLEAGDGASLSEEAVLRLVGREPAQVMVFDLN